MRHYFKFRFLNSSFNYRSSLFLNLCNSLIKYEFLKTTLIKAKELKIFFEPIISIGKNFSIFNFKFLFKKLNNLESVFKIFKLISPRYLNRNGGYLKIYKSGFRKGDLALKSLVFFV